MIFGWDSSSGEDKTVVIEAVELGNGQIKILDMKVIEELRPRPDDLVVDYKVLS